jgi:hypothetical protein
MKRAEPGTGGFTINIDWLQSISSCSSRYNSEHQGGEDQLLTVEHSLVFEQALIGLFPD